MPASRAKQAGHTGERHVALVFEGMEHSMAQGISRFGRSAGWANLITSSTTIGDRAAGVIAFYSPRMTWLLPRIHELGIPMVDVGPLCPDSTVPRVIGDEATCSEMSVQYFLARGFKSLACLHVEDDAPYQFRRTALRAAARAAGIAVQPLLDRADVMSAATFSRLTARIARMPKPLAIIAGCDFSACQLARACHRAGLAVPHQVAILALGDCALDRELSPVPLSYVNCNLERHGYEAAALLERMMNGEQPPRAPLIIRPVGVVTSTSTDVYAVEHPGIQRALAFVKNHFAGDIQVRDISAAAGMHRTDLLVKFHRMVGRTLHRHLVSVRLNRARELLLETDWSIERVAGETGFMLTANMRNAFQREFGMSPREYRHKFGTLGI